MIRINLLPVKRKKKPKPLPSFVVTATFITLLVIFVLGYLFYYYNSRLVEARSRFETNKQKIEELKKRIKEVDDFEKLNKTIEERNQIIEQLRKSQNMPVVMLDELSKALPKGVWLHSLIFSGNSLSLDGYGFTNSDVVAYVDNLKSSKVFTEISLQESKQVEIEKIPLYQFKITMKVVI
ncbi:MAG: PilN domain-containing protein [Thermodesulfovibrionales bacterium]